MEWYLMMHTAEEPSTVEFYDLYCMEGEKR